jgi:hypothetical protein
MGITPPTKPAPPPRKAVLIGGECDGRIVRLNFDPPAKLVVLVEDTDPDSVIPQTAFIAPQDAFPTAAVGRPVEYHLWPMVGFPEETRISAYIPVEFMPDDVAKVGA